MAQTPDIKPDQMTAVQIGGLLAGGLTDPIRLAEQTLAGIAACDDRAIFTGITRDRALAEARASAQRYRSRAALGLLDGVPVAWKDLFDMEGMVTTAGSKVLAREPAAAQDAPVVARLKAAGMIAVGRVNMTEFAYSGIGLNPHFGTPGNAHDKAHVPGGSSSGSGVAVGRGLVPISIGSDTGGSVRIPAAFNGIVGYKSTTGRYPMDGVFPLSVTLDSLGVLCRTVVDAALVDAAMRGVALTDLRPTPPAALRILVPTSVVFEGCDAAVVDHFEAAIGRLQAAGATIERFPFPHFNRVIEFNERYGAIVAAEAYALHLERVEGSDADLMDRRVVARTRLAASITMANYARALQARRTLIELATRDLGGRLVAYPTIAHTAPRIADLEADDAQFARMNAKTLRNTALGNYLDWCGISLPSGVDRAGLPTGFLLSGAPGRDDELLRAALGCERVITADFEAQRH